MSKSCLKSTVVTCSLQIPRLLRYSKVVISTESRKVLRCQSITLLLLNPENPLEGEEGGEGDNNTDENPW